MSNWFRTPKQQILRDTIFMQERLINRALDDYPEIGALVTTDKLIGYTIQNGKQWERFISEHCGIHRREFSEVVYRIIR